MQQVVIVLPAFEPDARLQKLVRRLRPAFPDIVVVNDGSRTSGALFDELAAVGGVTVLTHAENRGKGAALKTAFAEVLRRFPDACGVVTADADGQHLPEDIVRVAEALRRNQDRLVLGVRAFGAGVPFRSRLGNLWTVAEFRLLTGRLVRDTQTGLRGIPLALIPGFGTLPGERYDFEIRMLANAATQTAGIVQVPIETVYEKGNGTSHFRPLADTLDTQRALFAEALKSRFGRRVRPNRPPILV